MKKIMSILLAAFLLTAGAKAQGEKNKAAIYASIKDLKVPVNPANYYYFVSELDCNTCVEKLMNKLVAKQDKNAVYLIYYTPSKKRIAFSSTLFKDFVLPSHFYISRNDSLYDAMNKILPIGRGPYLFHLSNNSIVDMRSFSVE